MYVLWIKNTSERDLYSYEATKAAFTLGARVRFSLGTNVNTPFFQVPTPEFGHGQGRDLVLGH